LTGNKYKIQIFFSPKHADFRLLVIPISYFRVAENNPKIILKDLL